MRSLWLRPSRSGRSDRPNDLPRLHRRLRAARSVSRRPERIVNPTVILEVTSDGTEADDRGEKFAHYRHLPSLREYVIVSHRQQRVEVYRRETASWSLREYLPGTDVELSSLEVKLPVVGIYDDPNRA